MSAQKYTIYIKNDTKMYHIITDKDYQFDCNPTTICFTLKTAELFCRLLNENEDLINGNYHSVYSEPKEHCMGHQLIYKIGDESQTILAETFCDAVAKIIVKAMNEQDKPKIDKDFKGHMINHFKDKANSEHEWLNKQYEILIKVIQNLPTEEN